jgi:hypothetical protein
MGELKAETRCGFLLYIAAQQNFFISISSILKMQGMLSAGRHGESIMSEKPHLPPVFWYAALESLNIRQTRSRHLDTLLASTSIKVGNNPAMTSPIVSLGDHNDGSFQVPGCVTPAVRIPGLVTSVKIGITVLNSGNNDINEKIADIAEAIVSEGADDVVPGSGEILDVMYDILGPLAFADCDGPVVLAVLLFGGGDIHPHPVRPKPPHKVPFNGTDNGYNSPAGCGPNSIYDYSGHVVWEP